ncbi:MAG: hypothetical protein VXA48_16195 [Deltaproteobacteria bacterium]
MESGTTDERFRFASKIIQLAFAYVLITLTTAMIGIMTFQKGYRGLADWIFG